MKKLLVLAALTLTTTTFASTIWSEKGSIRTTNVEKYISVDLTQDVSGYLFDYKIYEPDSIVDENGKKHGGDFKFTIIKNPGIKGKVCVRLTTSHATQSIKECYRGPHEYVTTVNESGERITERIIPEAICTTTTSRTLLLRTVNGKARIPRSVSYTHLTLPTILLV